MRVVFQQRKYPILGTSIVKISNPFPLKNTKYKTFLIIIIEIISCYPQTLVEFMRQNAKN